MSQVGMGFAVYRLIRRPQHSLKTIKKLNCKKKASCSLSNMGRILSAPLMFKIEQLLHLESPPRLYLLVAVARFFGQDSIFQCRIHGFFPALHMYFSRALFYLIFLKVYLLERLFAPPL